MVHPARGAPTRRGRESNVVGSSTPRVTALPVAHQPDALVFTAPRGGALSYSSWRARFWVPAVEKAPLPDVGLP